MDHFTEAQLPIAMMRLPGIGQKKTLKYAQECGDSESAFFSVACGEMGKSKEAAATAWMEAGRTIVQCRQLGIRPIAFTNSDGQYPRQLDVLRRTGPNGRIKDERPPVIYVKGDIEALRHPGRTVAIVGTRNPTEHGMDSARRLGGYAAQKGISVVSGLAYGCDQQAHEGCTEEGGTAIAILAHGLDHIYPLDNKHLANTILDCGGCWVSEYPPGTKAGRWSFIARDRLQSALSDLIIVIQTGTKGGTMHTVGFAEQQGRPIACLRPDPDPAESNHPSVQGNWELLDNGRAYELAKPSDLQKILNPIPSSGDGAALEGSQFSLFDGHSGS
ncbi:MAG: DNA-protecting protein DprA [Bacteroidota bacterium]|nr:DNA-protecting protein DprA [Bacteroidota bacterium]